MLRNAARRIALAYIGILCITVVLSVVAGLAAGSVLRAIAAGMYVSGSLLLLGCFIMGVRGPLRVVSRRGETVPLPEARGLRKATLDERSEATQTSILLFLMGLSLVVLGALVDPSRRAL